MGEKLRPLRIRVLESLRLYSYTRISQVSFRLSCAGYHPMDVAKVFLLGLKN